MVKVVEKDPRDLQREERASKLASMVTSHLDNFIVNVQLSPASLAVRRVVQASPSSTRLAFHIYPLDNRIDVYASEYLNDAVRLAEIYEKAGEPEFIVKKDYSSD